MVILNLCLFSNLTNPDKVPGVLYFLFAAVFIFIYFNKNVGSGETIFFELFYHFTPHVEIVSGLWISTSPFSFINVWFKVINNLKRNNLRSMKRKQCTITSVWVILNFLINRKNLSKTYLFSVPHYLMVHYFFNSNKLFFILFQFKGYCPHWSLHLIFITIQVNQKDLLFYIFFFFLINFMWNYSLGEIFQAKL